MLYKSGIDGTRDITPEAVLADEASASVIAIRTLFAEQALDSFTTTPELEAQREELLKYVNKVLESRVGEASQSPNGLDKQLRRALEGANLDRFPGSSNFAGPPRPIAGRQRALSAANRGTLSMSSLIQSLHALTIPSSGLFCRRHQPRKPVRRPTPYHLQGLVAHGRCIHREARVVG
jgi:hypothetical protein